MVQQWRRQRKLDVPEKECPSSWSSAERRAEEAFCILESAIHMVECDPRTFGPRSLQSVFPERYYGTNYSAHSAILANNWLVIVWNVLSYLKQLCELKRASEKGQEKAGTERKDADSYQELSESERREAETARSYIDLTRDENLKLKEDLQALAIDNTAKALALATAQESCTCALEQVKKHKEVIARTTADNMLFLMKTSFLFIQLKQSEEDLRSTKAKHEDLQKQFDFYRSTWLEEASAEIEDAVRNSLDKAQACEIELQKLHRQQEIRMQECENKLQDLTNTVSTISAAKQHLEDRVKFFEEEKRIFSKTLEQESSEKHHIRIQNQSLTSTIDRCNQEVATADLEGRKNKENELFQDLESITDQLETQRVMNLSLMKKKEEVEWMCLEAQAEREKFKNQLRGLVKNRLVRMSANMPYIEGAVISLQCDPGSCS
ncbi:hypothetical protein SELMODRAFT_416485 [Selaginella moellendorffii]|uniref:Uncharacterized protein n=1 Tax=Selaginella moellendorffii TaxID=88036 RepID=D8RZF4_SELML|nr:hypothetical protein SELMODRAFT_416485 [Selaginella moellendorffii]